MGLESMWGDVDQKRIVPRHIQSKGIRKTTKKASIASTSTSNEDEETSDNKQEALSSFRVAIRHTAIRCQEDSNVQKPVLAFSLFRLEEPDVYIYSISPKLRTSGHKTLAHPSLQQMKVRAWSSSAIKVYLITSEWLQRRFVAQARSSTTG